METKTPAQVFVADVHHAGIESVLRRLRAEGKDTKDALYEIIMAAQKADCPALATTACTMYETTQD